VEPAWDYPRLRAWFEARAGRDVVETELLNEFFPDAGPLPVGLDLFQRHFLLYRRLWLFDDELRLSTGHRLWIRGIRATLIDPPPEGRCGRLDPEGRYCREEAPEGLCARHSGTAPELSMKTYYLDLRNLAGMTEEGVARLVDDFFRWWGDPQTVTGAVTEALATLGLPSDADARAVKAQWRRLSLEHHPDRGGDAQEYQRLSAAWAVLKPRS